ncbi:ATP-binding protein [Mycobacterium kubicae]|uniref:ATP-binding protein n=1 Tax=Mycobacterium kubicae TaxID=120959 RepID=UPI00268711E5
MATPTSRSGWRKGRTARARIAFATAVDWVARLKAAHNAGRLQAELAKLRRIGLLVVHQVGYIPFGQDAANLFFQLVASRYEQASLILTSNLPYASWGDVFGGRVVGAATIDCIVHHADVLTLKGSGYRLEDTGTDTLPFDRARQHATTTWPSFHRRSRPSFRPSSTMAGRGLHPRHHRNWHTAAVPAPSGTRR